jgi:hypothetical protein
VRNIISLLKNILNQMKIKYIFRFILIFILISLYVTDIFADNDVTDWKEYKIQKYGFSLKYPENFYITWEGDWDDKNNTEPIHVIDISKYKETPPTQYSGIRIIITKFNGNLSSYLKDRIKNMQDEGYNNTTLKALIIGNIYGFELSNNIIFIENGYLFNINNQIDEKRFLLIINSINFE